MVDLPLKNCGFYSYVSLPEGKPPFSYGFPMVFLWFSESPRVSFMALVIDPLSWTKISPSVGQLVPIKTRKPNLAKPCLSTAGCVAEWCWYIEYQHPVDIWEYIGIPLNPMWIQLANGCNHHWIPCWYIEYPRGKWQLIWNSMVFSPTIMGISWDFK